ncbi:MAG: hypothetical protein WBC60_07940 [Cognaticolwellia sp.]
MKNSLSSILTLICLLVIGSYFASLAYIKGYVDAPTLTIPIKNNKVVYEKSDPLASTTTMTKLTMISESKDSLEMEVEYFYDGSLGERATLCGAVQLSYDPENIHYYWSCRPSEVKAGKGKAQLSFGLSGESHEALEIFVSDQIKLEFYAHNPYRTVQLGKVNYYKAWVPNALTEKSQPEWQKSLGLEYVKGFYHAIFD